MSYAERKVEYLAEARAYAFNLGLNQDVVTVDDVRRHCPPPEGIDPRIMGNVFIPSEWESVGHVNSARKVSHKRPIQAFRLRNGKGE